MNMRASKDEIQPVSRAGLEQLQKEQTGLEVDLLDEVVESRRRAWMVASGFGALAMCCVAALIFVVYRYSQPVPTHLLAQDQATGAVTQVSLLEEQATYGELTDSYWVSEFIKHHEGYDFYTAQADYDAVGLMAAGDVADEYQQKFKGPEGMDKVLGDSERTTVEVSSVILDSSAKGIATVRYSTQKKYRTRSAPEPKKYWIAQLSFTYDNILLTAQQRFINPLGFRVRSFRTNLENVGG